MCLLCYYRQLISFSRHLNIKSIETMECSAVYSIFGLTRAYHLDCFSSRLVFGRFPVSLTRDTNIINHESFGNVTFMLYVNNRGNLILTSGSRNTYVKLMDRDDIKDQTVYFGRTLSSVYTRSWRLFAYLDGYSSVEFGKTRGRVPLNLQIVFNCNHDNDSDADTIIFNLKEK